MNKMTRLILILIVGAAFNLHAQILNQDAEGKSTIVFNGGVIDFDLGKTSLSFDYNNFFITNKPNLNTNKPDFNNYKPKGLVLGIRAAAKNQSVIARLFDSGKLTPEGSISGFLGYFCSSHPWESENLKEWKGKKLEWKQLREKEKKLSNSKKRLQNNIKENKYKQEFEAHISGLPHKTKEELNRLRLTHFEDTAKLFTHLNKFKGANNQPVNEAVDKIITDIKKLDTKMSGIVNEFKKTKREREKLEGAATYQRRLGYVNFGIKASSFKHYSETGTGDLNDNFENKYFRGGFVNFGLNLQMGGAWLMGTSFGYEYTNNLSSLSKNEYTLETTRASGAQKLTSEEKITAYSGNYDKFGKLSANGDIIHMVDLGDKVLALNLFYFRWQFPLEDGYPNTLNIGIGGSFFSNKGKFLGGIYLEAPDLTNEKEDERNLLNRLTFGIVVKFAFAPVNF